MLRTVRIIGMCALPGSKISSQKHKAGCFYGSEVWRLEVGSEESEEVLAILFVKGIIGAIT